MAEKLGKQTTAGGYVVKTISLPREIWAYIDRQTIQEGRTSRSNMIDVMIRHYQETHEKKRRD